MSGKTFQGDTSMLMYQAGLSSVGSYQMSGIPFATASLTVPIASATPLKVQFPYVTKFVTIINTGSVTTPSIRVGFSALGTSGSGTNYFSLAYGESYTGEWRIEDLFLISNAALQSSASVVAGLTPIPRGIPSLLTNSSLGNNWSGSSGVG
jgi:hypothetical protein